MSLTLRQRTLIRRMLRGLRVRRKRDARMLTLASRVMCWRCHKALVRCKCPVERMEDFYQ